MKERYLYNVSKQEALNRLAQKDKWNFGHVQTQESDGGSVTGEGEEPRSLKKVLWSPGKV